MEDNRRGGRRLSLLRFADARGTPQTADTVVSVGTLALWSHHVVGGNILLPGVGYIELAFATDMGRRSVLSAVVVVQPCVLPHSSTTREPCVLR